MQQTTAIQLYYKRFLNARPAIPAYRSYKPELFWTYVVKSTLYIYIYIDILLTKLDAFNSVWTHYEHVRRMHRISICILTLRVYDFRRIKDELFLCMRGHFDSIMLKYVAAQLIFGCVLYTICTMYVCIMYIICCCVARSLACLAQLYIVLYYIAVYSSGCYFFYIHLYTYILVHGYSCIT